MKVPYRMTVGALRQMLDEFNKDDVELICYSMDCTSAELTVEPYGDLLMEDGVG